MSGKLFLLCLLTGLPLVSLGQRHSFYPRLALGLFAAYGLRKRARPHRQAALERIRARLAADLHDDIGANLSHLAILAETLRHQNAQEHPQLAAALEPMARISGETVDALSDIVWATNPQHDSLSNLTRRMRRYASELLPAAKIEFSFNAPNTFSEIHLEGETRRQIFLIFKESLNNLVRHAHCTQAMIELRLANQHLLLQIRDNGVGFETASLVEGNGLRNLQRRAQVLGAQLEIGSLPTGTTIQLHVPHQPSGWTNQLAHWWRNSNELVIGAYQKVNAYLNRGVTAYPISITLPTSSARTVVNEVRGNH